MGTEADTAWVELDPFYAKVKFDHIGFIWEKVNIIFFWKLLQP